MPQDEAMPLTVVDCKSVPETRRERIDAAVIAGGGRTADPHGAWIAADLLRGGIRVLITGPPGFERTIGFAVAQEFGVIT